MPSKPDLTKIKPGMLCLDGLDPKDRNLCVLVDIVTPDDAPWARMMQQVGMLGAVGYFLDLEEHEIRFGSLHRGEENLDPNISGSNYVGLFTRNLDAVVWLDPQVYL